MYKQFAEEIIEKILRKLEVTAPEIGARFPHQADNLTYDEEDERWWTNGFWPGILWLAYKYTNNEMFAQIANEIEEKMDKALFDFEGLHHDVGFMWLLSSGGNLRYKENIASHLRLLKAANILMGRFNLAGKFIRAWNEDYYGWAIIDCMMNLPLLYWASKESGDPRFNHIAKAHIDTVLKYFVREDGSVCHIASFDPQSGEFLEQIGGQGASADSAWSRGAAWAIYGMALAYGNFRDERYLNASRKIADFFIANLPSDMVCHWDFKVPRNADTPRDSSAAACAACGLLELSKYLPKDEKNVYSKKAYLILKSLTEHYADFTTERQAILKESVRHLPAGQGINVGLIYADYFYFEGITRLLGNDDILWR